MNWSGIEKVIGPDNGTGLRSGVIVYSLPDTAPPAVITPKQFPEMHKAWRTA